MQSKTCDAIVVGGGLHGLSAALHLGQAGLRTVVLEKDHVGRHASGVNAGGVRRLGRHLSEVPLAEAAMQIWHHIEEFVGNDCGFVRCGQIKVAENDEELAALKNRAMSVRAIGYHHEEIIDRDTLRDWVPAIAPHCVGAMLCRDDGAALPYRTVMAFASTARKHGATVHEQSPVTHIERQADIWHVRAGEQRVQAPLLINAAGAWAAGMAAQLGESLPIGDHAPMLMITERVAPFISPVLGAVGRTLSFKQFDNGTVLIGGGYFGESMPDCNQARVSLHTLADSARTVTALFPQLAKVRIVRCWAGIEGIVSDGIPILGASSRVPGLYYSCGYSAHGYQLAPVTGRILTELIMHGRSELPTEPFSAERFSNEIPSVNPVASAASDRSDAASYRAVASQSATVEAHRMTHDRAR